MLRQKQGTQRRKAPTQIPRQASPGLCRGYHTTLLRAWPLSIRGVSTGNCTCPHAQAGNQCKHVLYVLARALRVRFSVSLPCYPPELVEIFQHAPPIQVGDSAENPEENRNRKPVEGNCPICFLIIHGDTVFCRAMCGQNIHTDCFEMWAATKGAENTVTCPMCRTPWQGDNVRSRELWDGRDTSTLPTSSVSAES